MKERHESCAKLQNYLPNPCTMKPSKLKPSPANIVECIHREIINLSWNWETIIKAGRALGVLQAKERYETREFSYALLMVSRDALERFGTNKAVRRPRGRLPWRLKLFEMWTAAELDANQAGQIVREHATTLAEKVEPEAPKPPKKKRWVSSGVMGSEFKIEHSTAVAICKAIEHMGYLGGEYFGGERVNRQVNEMIRAAAEAVTMFVPKSPLGFRDSFAFTARDETRMEREMRLLLEAMSK